MTKSLFGPPRSALGALVAALSITSAAIAADVAQPKDPVPHALTTQPYRVCQDLEELTSRIDNLYRKPFDKTIDPKSGQMQQESMYFKDTQTGVEIVSLTRELCSDISHPDLGRPCWTRDGSHILFMGSRAYLRGDGKLEKNDWEGHKYVMSADYTRQRPMGVRFEPAWENAPKYIGGGGTVSRVDAGIYSKFNILDPTNPKLAYYAVTDKLWQVTLSDDGDSVAKLICTFSNDRPKIIQDISPTRRLVIQDANTRPDADGKLPYMPEFHLVDLNKQPGEAGFYYHHPMDYGLPEVKDDKGRIVHAASFNHWVHAIAITPDGNTLTWNYGPMTSVGEPLSWELDIRNGLDGTPTHNDASSGSGTNRWGQYESHGQRLGGGNYALYFSGTPNDTHGKPLPGKWGWGVYIRDTSKDDALPAFIMTAPGGHIAGGNSANPDVWAAYVGMGWKIPAADTLVWGRAREGTGAVLCNTYSAVRGWFKGNPFSSWTGPDVTEGRPYSAIPRPLMSPDGTKVWFHSAMLQPSLNWVGAYVAVIQRPEPPLDLIVSRGDGVQLTWKPAAMSSETKGYHVYRGDADGKSFVELTHTAIAETKFTDRTARAGNTYTYAVTAEEWSTLESDRATSLTASVEADDVTAAEAKLLKDWDKTAPPPVQDFVVKADAPGQYRLTWSKNPASDLRCYNVYFSAKDRPQITQQRRVVSPPAGTTQYLDWSAQIDGDAHYAITAVDRQGNESSPAYADPAK